MTIKRFVIDRIALVTLQDLGEKHRKQDDDEGEKKNAARNKRNLLDHFGEKEIKAEEKSYCQRALKMSERAGKIYK